jgi:hypothetical protein
MHVSDGIFNLNELFASMIGFIDERNIIELSASRLAARNPAQPR